MADSSTTVADARLKGRIVRLVIAGALALLGAVCLAIAIFWQPEEGTGWVPAHELFIQLWPFFLTVAAAILVYEEWLRTSFIEEIKRISGPQLVRALRPREVLEPLLDDLYGPNSFNEDVVVAVLGGYGDAEGGRDLTISEATRVLVRLENTTDPEMYALTFEVSYIFRQDAPAERSFVYFVTCDPLLRDLIPVSCDERLFDFWYLPEFTQLPELATLKESISISLAYEDAVGKLRHTETVPIPKIEIEEVRPEEWARYLRFFRIPVGAVKTLAPSDYRDRLAIIKFSFEPLLRRVFYTPTRVRGLTISSTTQVHKSDGYCYWVAPFPCFVDQIHFDVRMTHPETDEPLRFRTVPFLLRGDGGVAGPGRVDTWSEHPGPVRPEAWLLPGHGVALVWGPIEGTRSSRPPRPQA